MISHNLKQAFTDLVKLKLPLDEYSIIGSGPLAIRGLRIVVDIDLIVTEKLLKRLKSRCNLIKKKFTLCIKDTNIEIWTSCPGILSSEFEEIIQTSDIIDDFRFVSLENTIRWKLSRYAPKDENDIRKIFIFLLKSNQNQFHKLLKYAVEIDRQKAEYTLYSLIKDSDVLLHILNSEVITLARRTVPSEEGFSASYLPQNAILLPFTENAQKQFSWFRKFYKLRGTKPYHDIIKTPTPKNSLLYMQKTGKSIYYDEGYDLDPIEEDGIKREKIIDLLEKNNYIAIATKKGRKKDWPSSMGHSKVYFRNVCKKVLGEDSVPFGVHLSSPSQKAVLKVFKKFELRGYNKVILKKNGSGGSGNLIIDLGNIPMQRLLKFLENNPKKWLVIEAFIPWYQLSGVTMCCTFFALDEKNVIFMESVEQLLSGDSCTFSGSTNILSIKNIPLQAKIVKLSKKVTDELIKIGVRGICGPDIIIFKGKFPGINIGDGYKLNFLESTCRMGGDDEIRRSLAFLADKDQMPYRAIKYIHCEIGKALGKDIHDVRTYFKKTLKTINSNVNIQIAGNYSTREGDSVLIYGLKKYEKELLATLKLMRKKQILKIDLNENYK